jgi:hypothetical protein
MWHVASSIGSNNHWWHAAVSIGSKKHLVSCSRRHWQQEALGVMQQAALAACIINNYMYATKEPFAC